MFVVLYYDIGYIKYYKLFIYRYIILIYINYVVCSIIFRYCFYKVLYIDIDTLIIPLKIDIECDIHTLIMIIELHCFIN